MLFHLKMLIILTEAKRLPFDIHCNVIIALILFPIVCIDFENVPNRSLHLRLYFANRYERHSEFANFRHQNDRCLECFLFPKKRFRGIGDQDR